MASILIVDDSPTIVRFARTALEREGHTVEASRSFVALATLVANNPPDAIILDLDMPALSGMSVGRLIRKYQSRDIPVIIYSARPAADLLEAGKEIAASATLVKNGSADELRLVVRRTLDSAARRAG